MKILRKLSGLSATHAAYRQDIVRKQFNIKAQDRKGANVKSIITSG